MEIEKIKSKLIKPIRISPHGLTYLLSGITTTACFFSNSDSEGVYSLGSMIGGAIGGGLLTYGACYYRRELKKFSRLKRFIQEKGVNEVHIKLNLPDYCHRQVYKAVADSLDFRDTFDRVKNDFPKNKLKKAWMPDV